MCLWAPQVMLARAVLPKIRAMRSIPSSACARSALEIFTCLAVNSTSMVSLRFSFLTSACGRLLWNLQPQIHRVEFPVFVVPRMPDHQTGFQIRGGDRSVYAQSPVERKSCL